MPIGKIFSTIFGGIKRIIKSTPRAFKNSASFLGGRLRTVGIITLTDYNYIGSKHIDLVRLREASKPIPGFKKLSKRDGKEALGIGALDPSFNFTGDKIPPDARVLSITSFGMAELNASKNLSRIIRKTIVDTEKGIKRVCPVKTGHMKESIGIFPKIAVVPFSLRKAIGNVYASGPGGARVTWVGDEDSFIATDHAEAGDKGRVPYARFANYKTGWMDSIEKQFVSLSNYLTGKKYVVPLKLWVKYEWETEVEDDEGNRRKVIVRASKQVQLNVDLYLDDLIPEIEVLNDVTKNPVGVRIRWARYCTIEIGPDAVLPRY